MNSYQTNAVGKDLLMSSCFCSTHLFTRVVIATFRAALMFALISALLVVATQPAWAQTETVLYAFPGTKSGLEPQGGLARDGKGNLYGTTAIGGTPGDGTLFEITAAGAESLLHNFKAIQTRTYLKSPRPVCSVSVTTSGLPAICSEWQIPDLRPAQSMP